MHRLCPKECSLTAELAVKRKSKNVDVGGPEATALFLRYKKRLSVQQSKMLEERVWLWVAVGLGYFCDGF